MSREEIVNHIAYQQTITAFEYANQHFNKKEISEHNAAFNAFEAGAEWMQKKMIDKACEWIQCMALDYMQGDITDVKWGSMLADFRKAMGE